jgi:hypothetical protein
MTLTRRHLLQRALIAATAAAAASGAGRALAGGAPTMAPVLRIFDSRNPSSRRWAGEIAENVIDVAEEHSSRWIRLRSLATSGRVAGLTTWSDYVQARGVLLEKGRRLRIESRSAALFYWEMV